MSERRRRGWYRIPFLVALLGSTGMPLAQPSAQPVGEFEQLGLRTERWHLFPSLALTTSYNDNVFAVPDDDPRLTSDVIFTASPQVRLEANTRRHALAITAGGQIQRYMDETDQNFEGLDVGLSGRWDVTRTFDVSASFAYSRAAEDQTDPDRTLLDELRTENITVNNFSGNLTASKDWQRVFADASVGVRRVSYEELDAAIFDVTLDPATGIVTVTDTGETANLNADRDLIRIPLNFRVGYDVGRNYNVFVNLGYTMIRYDEPDQNVEQTLGFITGIDEGDDQDFETLSLRVGSGLDFDRLVTGDFSVGAERRFAAEGEDDELGLSFTADLDWTLSPRTSLNVSGSQGFEPAAGDGDGSSLTTRVGLDLSYALSRQISLGSNVEYLRDDRTEGGRTDDDITAGLSASYSVNRYASVSAGYRFRQRTSTETVREFTRNTVFVSLVGRY